LEITIFLIFFIKVATDMIFNIYLYYYQQIVDLMVITQFF